MSIAEDSRIRCCLVGLVFLTAVSVAQTQPDRVDEPSDFIALSNSVRQATTTNWMYPRQDVYFPRESFEHLRFASDLMDLLPTARAEVVCYQHSGLSSTNAQLFWMTDDAVYKITIPLGIFLERDVFSRGVNLCIPCTLSVSQTARTKAFDDELEAFEAVPLTESTLDTFDAPYGFYARRASDGTFESIFFPVILDERLISIPKGSDVLAQERIKALNDKRMRNPHKMAVFYRLLKTFDGLMAKSVVWSDDGIPRTLP